MSYLFILDQFDSLGFSDLSNNLAQYPPEEWFKQDELLTTLFTIISTYCQIQIHYYSNDVLESFYANHIQIHTNTNPPLTSLNTSQIPKIFYRWLELTECYYLDLLFEKNPDMGMNCENGNIETTYQLFLTQDGAGLTLSFLLSEYQQTIYSIYQSNNGDIPTNTTMVDHSSDNPATTNPKTNSSAKPSPDASFNAALIETQTLLSTSQCSNQPSLSQLLSDQFSSLSNYLLQIDATLQTFGEISQKNDQTQARLNNSLQLAPSIKFLPHVTGMTLLTSVKSKIDILFSYFRTLSSQFNLKLEKQPLSRKFSSDQLLSSLGLSDNITNFNFHPHLIPAQTLHKLTPKQLFVAMFILLQIREDYKSRHRMLLQRFITQTTTFLLTFKYNHLILTQSSSFNSRNVSSTTASSTLQLTQLMDYLLPIYQQLSSSLLTLPHLDLMDILYVAPHVVLKFNKNALSRRTFNDKSVNLMGENKGTTNHPKTHILRQMTDRNGRI